MSDLMEWTIRFFSLLVGVYFTARAASFPGTQSIEALIGGAGLAFYTWWSA